MLIGIIVWVALSFVVAAGARNRGRSGLAWFLLACVISPLIAGVALLVIGRKPQLRDE